MLASLDPASFNKRFLDTEEDADLKIKLKSAQIKAKALNSKVPKKPSEIQDGSSNMDAFSLNEDDDGHL